MAQRVVLSVPFVSQLDHFCGPAALAEVAQYRGVAITQQELARRVFLPGRKGSLAIELVSASRSLGLLPYLLDRKFASILLEVNAGNPVLVLQNLGLSWWPKWHFAVVTGYDLATEEVILHSGERANYRLGFATFNATWRRADSWAMVVMDGQVLPETAVASRYVSAANAFEQGGKLELAQLYYHAALSRWPDSRLAMIALANIAYSRGDYRQSISLNRKVLAQHPDAAAVWNNLAYALLAEQCPQQAKAAIARALTLAPTDSNYQQSAEEINRVAGDHSCRLTGD
ncbi:MAG: PA2778 family cysteine peptidase [Spongiibacteraceae bacterium]